MTDVLSQFKVGKLYLVKTNDELRTEKQLILEI